MHLERLTPRGPGGVALVGCSGPGADRAISAAFVRTHGEGLPRVGHMALGRILDSKGTPVDEVLLVRTARDTFEVGCHGGPAVVDRVHAALQAAGAATGGGEPLSRETGDRIRAEAREALPLATTRVRMSRSVKIPITLSPLVTTTAPIRRSFMSLAASSTVESLGTVATSDPL